MKTRRIKPILSVAMFLFVAGLLCLVQSNAETAAAERTRVNPCGIEFPKPPGYVNDFTGLFTIEEKNILDSIIKLHERETTNQIAIITIDSTMMGKCNIDQYTFEIANEWGVGQKGKNNGIVIGIAPGLRMIRIQNGYGIEQIMTDAETKYIIDSIMVPSFKNADYFEGTKKGLAAIFKELLQNPSISF